jgi:hypothetical protein
MKPVTRDEFEQFVTTYPRVLERDVARMAEPPVVTYNDFSLGNWPESIVARHTFEAPDSPTPCSWCVKEKA